VAAKHASTASKRTAWRQEGNMGGLQIEKERLWLEIDPEEGSKHQPRTDGVVAGDCKWRAGGSFNAMKEFLAPFFFRMPRIDA